MFGEAFDARPLRSRLTRLPGPLFPPMGDRAAWEALAPADRADLMALADKYRDAPYAPCTATQFLAYTREGSRVACEQPYFQRRRKLIAAVMDCCVTGRTDALDAVIDGLWCVCEETSWVISAHNEGGPLPDPDNPVIDLFAAQTAMILGLTCQLLSGPLDSVTPLLRARVRRETRLRVLEPFMARDDYWWMGFTRRDLCNWTPWIVSNVLTAACVWAENAEALAALTDRGLRMVDRWLAVVPEDGGCDEGAGYWNMAGGALLDCLTLLETLTEGDAAFWQTPKIQAMLSFPRKMALPGGWFVNFADCDARPELSGERLQTAGEKLGDEALRALGVALRGKPSDAISDVPHFTRLLTRLFHPAREVAGPADGPREAWLPDLQVRVHESDGLILCCKGGHNGESHNHNDVGSFMLYAGDRPAIIDAGNMTYTARTFSGERYTLWNTRSAYHNVPLIGGCEQRHGAEHAARDVAATPEGLTLDMAGAYGPEAGLSRARRTLALRDGRFTLADEIDLAKARPVTWVFLTRERPELAPGAAAFSGLTLRFDPTLTARAEEIPVTDPRMARHYPGSLWRLTLAAPAAQTHRQSFTAAREG